MPQHHTSKVVFYDGDSSEHSELLKLYGFRDTNAQGGLVSLSREESVLLVAFSILED